MKITAFHIEGFGIFRDFQVRGLGEGVTVFVGPNEAGKSTLLDFIRYTLYGYPRQKGKKGKEENLHEPLRGGRHGGRIEIDFGGDAGRVTVVCYRGEEPRVEGFAGKSGRAALEKLLRGISADTFKEYFAFGLDELAEVRAGVPEDLDALFLEAAQAGRMRTPGSVLKEIESRKKEIYLRRGRNQPVVAALRELGELRREIERLRKRPVQYEEKCTELHNIEERLRWVRANREKLSGQIGELEQTLAVKGLFFEWREAKQIFEAVERVEDFPPDGVRRLEDLEGAIARLEEERAAAREAVRRHKERLSAQKPDGRLLGRSAAIERLVRERSAFEDRERRRVELERKGAELRRRAESEIARLGGGWTSEKVRGVAADLLAEDRVRGPAGRIGLLEQRLEGERKEAGEEKAHLESLEKQLERARGAAERAGEEAIGRLDARIAALEEWLEFESRRSAARERAENLERQLEQARSERAEVENRRRLLEARPAPFRQVVFPAVAALLAVVAGGLAVAEGKGPLAAIIFLAALFLGGWVFWTWRAAGRVAAESRSEKERLEQRIGALGSQIEQLEGKLADALAEEKAAGAKCLEIARRVGLGPDVETPRVKEVLRGAEREREGLVAEVSQRRGRLEEIGRQVEESRKKVEKRTADIGKLETELEKARRELAAALGSVGLPEALSPETALEAFARIRDIQALLAEAEAAESGAAEERAVLEEFARRVFALAREVGIEARGDWRVVLGELERGLERERKAEERCREIEAEIKSAEARLEALERECGRRGREREDLLEAGGAAGDPELFRRRAQKARRFAEAQERLETARAKLEAHLPPGVSLESFIERLEATDWAEKEGDVERRRSDLEAFKKEEEELAEKRGRLLEEIEEMEHRDELFELRQREEGIRARLAEYVRRWNVLAVAEELMRRVQEIYERERQPSRVRRASELFRRFTRGGFERVRIDEEGGGILAVRSNLEQLAPRHLSRGTREQLYLAVRLALVDELAERGLVFPLLFDDILVNFDDARTREAAETLAETARGRQLWFFTAHKATLDLWQEVCSPRVVRLDVGGRTG